MKKARGKWGKAARIALGGAMALALAGAFVAPTPGTEGAARLVTGQQTGIEQARATYWSPVRNLRLSRSGKTAKVTFSRPAHGFASHGRSNYRVKLRYWKNGKGWRSAATRYGNGTSFSLSLGQVPRSSLVQAEVCTAWPGDDGWGYHTYSNCIVK